MHSIWIFYLGAMTGAVVTMAVLALFAVGSRADRPLSSSALLSETWDAENKPLPGKRPDNQHPAGRHREHPV